MHVLVKCVRVGVGCLNVTIYLMYAVLYETYMYLLPLRLPATVELPAGCRVFQYLESLQVQFVAHCLHRQVPARGI